MNLEMKIIGLCEDFVSKLNVLKDKEIITEVEFEEMSKSKLKFINEHKEGIFI